MIIAVSKEELEARCKYSNFYRLISAYRELGHKQADIDPIALSKPQALSELQAKRFGLDLQETVCLHGLLAGQTKNNVTIGEALNILNKIYSGTISAEFSYLEVFIYS